MVGVENEVLGVGTQYQKPGNFLRDHCRRRGWGESSANSPSLGSKVARSCSVNGTSKVIWSPRESTSSTCAPRTYSRKQLHSVFVRDLLKGFIGGYIKRRCNKYYGRTRKPTCLYLPNTPVETQPMGSQSWVSYNTSNAGSTKHSQQQQPP